MKLEINFHNLFGDPKGEKLFIVINDEDESSLWLANDENHLQQLVRDEYLGEFDEDDTIVESFDLDWGYNILFNEVGKRG